MAKYNAMTGEVDFSMALEGKDGSRQRVMELWPDKAALFKRVKDDGRADAALIAQ